MGDLSDRDVESILEGIQPEGRDDLAPVVELTAWMRASRDIEPPPAMSDELFWQVEEGFAAPHRHRSPAHLQARRGVQRLVPRAASLPARPLVSMVAATVMLVALVVAVGAVGDGDTPAAVVSRSGQVATTLPSVSTLPTTAAPSTAVPSTLTTTTVAPSSGSAAPATSTTEAAPARGDGTDAGEGKAKDDDGEVRDPPASSGDKGGEPHAGLPSPLSWWPDVESTLESIGGGAIGPAADDSSRSGARQDGQDGQDDDTRASGDDEADGLVVRIGIGGHESGGESGQPAP